MTLSAHPRAVVLVEGESDQWALEALAARRGRDLVAEGVSIVAMGGITNSYKHLTHCLSAGLRVVGLYDAGERDHVARAVERAGLGVRNLVELGFFGCDADLEDELIRALGVARVEAVVEAAGDLRSLRLLQGMPAQRGWTAEAVLHRFMGVRSGRKRVYARLLVEALDLDAVPAPLDAVLEAVR